MKVNFCRFSFNWFWMQSFVRGLRGWFCSFYFWQLHKKININVLSWRALRNSLWKKRKKGTELWVSEFSEMTERKRALRWDKCPTTMYINSKKHPFPWVLCHQIPGWKQKKITTPISQIQTWSIISHNCTRLCITKQWKPRVD